MNNIRIAITKKDGASGWYYKIVENQDNTGTIKNVIDSQVPDDVLEFDDKISDSIQLRIVWHDAIALGEEETKIFKEHFAQNYLIEKDIVKYPIIHFLEESNIEENGKILEYLYCDGELSPNKDSNSIPRFFSILDSSIWNFLVPLGDYCNSENSFNYVWLDAFKKALESISANYQRCVYSLEIASEYADLNARLTGESFLNGAHSVKVSPFIFHSESEIRQLIHKEFETPLGGSLSESSLQRIKKHNWRILLVDDKSEDLLTGINGVTGVTKLSIIKSLLEQQFNGMGIESNKFDKAYSNCNEENNPKNNTILVEYAENVKDAENALRSKKYDIILLDYLLEKDRKVEYGYQLLEKIYEFQTAESIADGLVIHEGKDKLASIIDSIFSGAQQLSRHYELVKYIKNNRARLNELYQKKKNELIDNNDDLWYMVLNEQFKKDEYKIGPHGKIFFIFISAYSSAVYERLLAQGINQSEDYWFISVGACPTNTPQLFLYNLIKLMEKRLDDSGILKLSSDGIYKLINRIYLRKEDAPKKDSIRKRANAHYQEVLSLQYHYRSILRDVEIPFGNNSSTFATKGSVLMTDFIQNKINLGGMLEHLTRLVHLTAFGTIRQWQEMWEEYVYFKAQFEKQLDEVSLDNFNSLCQNIENYILELKSQQQ